MALPRYSNSRAAVTYDYEPRYTNNKKGDLPRELAAEYKEVIEKIRSLKEELKRYRITLDLLENNPQRYLKIKEFDPFGEEKWEQDEN